MSPGCTFFLKKVDDFYLSPSKHRPPTPFHRENKTNKTVRYGKVLIFCSHYYPSKAIRKDKQGGDRAWARAVDLPARSFDLERPGVAPPPLTYNVIKHRGNGSIAVLRLTVCYRWAISLFAHLYALSICMTDQRRGQLLRSTPAALCSYSSTQHRHLQQQQHLLNQARANHGLQAAPDHSPRPDPPTRCNRPATASLMWDIFRPGKFPV